jgi:phospholipid-binding lipoprotein MlaA
MNQNKTDGKSWVALTAGLIMLVAVGVAATAVGGEAAVGRSDPVLREENESDPWEPFNSKMFSFNHDVLDQYVLKPVAKAWNFVMPEVVQRSLRNAIDNTNMPSRLVNSLAQGKFVGAGRELARFTINTSIGIGGLIDLAKDGFGIEKSDEDTGQTLGFYGVGPGPYLVPPFLPPTDVRDGIGTILDGAMNPLNYILPFAAGADGATTIGTLAGITATDAVNRRSLNLELYEGVEETVIDLYSAVRNAYLQKREALIKQ